MPYLNLLEITLTIILKKEVSKITGTIELPVPVDALVKSLDQLMLERGDIYLKLGIDDIVFVK